MTKIHEAPPLTAPAHLRRIARLDTSGQRRRDVWINARAAQVIATVSDPIDKYVLQDTANLDTYVGTRLTDKVMDALETEVITGDGQEGHLTGLASITGIQEQAWDSTMLDTIAITGDISGPPEVTVVPTGFAVRGSGEVSPD